LSRIAIGTALAMEHRMPKPISGRIPSVTRCSKRTVALALPAACALAGCLERPVSPAQPTTTNVYVHTINNRVVDKLDLLFMIDNSMSMADKQETLAKAVPILVRRLVTPSCFDDQGNPTGESSDASGHCARGRPEMAPIKDIHIGVITSSLGSHGGTECLAAADDSVTGRTPDDRAELLPTANPAVRGPLDSWNQSGFLAWDPTQSKNTPPGEHNVQNLVGDFTDQVRKAGEHGCGYEGSLEAWYRFLVDPEPPVSVSSSVNADQLTINQKGPVNQTVLAQRKAFLRPDSLLAIVMLTDENDCSIIDEDGTQGWLASNREVLMPRASAACATNPNDRCCHTCAAPAPEGCTPNDADAECGKPAAENDAPRLARSEDHWNLRCFEQKRRFGMDLLYPIDRYVRGLSEKLVHNRAGEPVPNPIFKAPPGMPERARELVILAGIVGVPWQDIAQEKDLTGPGLTFLTAAEMRQKGRWDMILGSASGAPPTDPLMRESIAPRTGTHPLLGTMMGQPSSTTVGENPINGHEQNVVRMDDLQYACTFPLPTPRQCNVDNALSCDCTKADQAYDRSLCEYPDGPETDGIQIAAKAYPGLRELAVIRGLEDNGVVASICVKSMTPAAGLTEQTDGSYGYNPAIAAIGDIVKARIGRPCLPRPLPVEENGQVPCAVVEAVPPNGQACSCEGEGRAAFGPDDAKLRAAVVADIANTGRCDGKAGTACRDYCLCKVKPLEGSELAACQAGTEDSSTFGYCYIDPAQGIGNPELVQECGSTMQRSLRLVGDGLPANGSLTFMACLGATLSDQ
jgi:hypothetical protein